MKLRVLIACAATAPALFVLCSCGSREAVNAQNAAPPSAQVVTEPDLNLVKVDRPERFRLVKAGSRDEVPELQATGVISPDVEKSIPVISLAAGRVVGIYVKLGDDVTKGQLLLKVMSNDIANAFQTYQQAVADEELAHKQLERAETLYDHGAISLNDLQVAQNTENKAAVAVKAGLEMLRNLGADPAHPDPVVSIYAPASGTIVEQNVVSSAIIRTPDNQTNLFTIANLSTVWVICNIYENDLPEVRLGDPAQIRLNAYDNRSFTGRIVNIGKVLDPNTRTAPVRIVLANPGMMRSGMFVTATLYGQHHRTYAAVPAQAVLHLHDRNWVFVPSGNGEFRRSEVAVGKIVDGEQIILSGITPGTEVVNDSLALSAESQQ
ncbi:MAG: efflux RND transporter periplasmic adaptor subunit [Acidobacteriaceae bacterium]|nr:efflux RND transporter periplasmic adaptor subunit [Acidobacteriaceae bacterium]